VKPPFQGISAQLSHTKTLRYFTAKEHFGQSLILLKVQLRTVTYLTQSTSSDSPLPYTKYSFGQSLILPKVQVRTVTCFISTSRCDLTLAFTIDKPLDTKKPSIRGLSKYSFGQSLALSRHRDVI